MSFFLDDDTLELGQRYDVMIQFISAEGNLVTDHVSTLGFSLGK